MLHGADKDMPRTRLKTSSVFKRVMIGVYQHCGETHPHRDLAEFDFRYNRHTALKVSDTERAEQLLQAARGKHLTYRRIGEAGHA